MFRKNNAHQQERLFSQYNDLDKRLKKRLQGTWAPVFYEHVFCNIEEDPFAVLYCQDNGRPNFPVNILVALELIKHWKDFTDEELIEQASFNYQIAYAIGLRNLGEEYIAPRTLYEFRDRVYRHTLQHGADGDLIFGQFQKLTRHFMELTGTKSDEQRMDSSLLLPNIQKAGRLALAFDVLHHAVDACPDTIRTESLKSVLHPAFKTKMLYKTKVSGLEARMNQLLQLSQELLAVVQDNSTLKQLPPIALLERFLSEQGNWDEAKQIWTVKDSKEISAESLQSAHDPDATYRKKGNTSAAGYVCNLSETCSKDNAAQLITDYTVEKNTTADVDMIQHRLPIIKETTNVKELYVDGGYYGEEVEKVAQQEKVTMHYSAMTGRKPADGKLTYDQFEIQNRQIIVSCPAQQQPIRAAFDEQSRTLSAHFTIETCQQCPRLPECPVKFQKKEAAIRVSQKRVLADETRKTLAEGGQKEATSRRAAIEGTNSALKRGQCFGRLMVRGLCKSRVVAGLKIIGHNFQQTLHSLIRQANQSVKSCIVSKVPILQGSSLPS